MVGSYIECSLLAAEIAECCGELLFKESFAAICTSSVVVRDNHRCVRIQNEREVGCFIPQEAICPHTCRQIDIAGQRLQVLIESRKIRWAL